MAFIAVEDLDADTDVLVRWEGGDELVDHVERSHDGHHWRITFVGWTRYVVVPPGARFTRIN